MPVTALVTAADVRAHLNLGDTTHDSELQGFIDGAQVVVENIIGPVVSQTVTEWHDGGVTDIELNVSPVLSVTSVTEYSGSTTTTVTEASDPASATSSQFTRDRNVITRRAGGGGIQTFAWGHNAVKVVYAAGLDTCPSNVRMAALELIRGWYQQTQQGGRPSFAGSPARDTSAAQAPPTRSFTIPARVRELLEPNEHMPGLA